MKKKAFWISCSAFILILGCLVGAATGVLKGAWMDRAVSYYFSKLAGVKISLYDVRFFRTLTALRFGVLSVSEPDKKNILLASGPGEARVVGGFFIFRGDRRVEIRLDDVAIMEDLCAKSSIIHWATRQAFDRPILIRSIRFSLKENARGTVLRVLSCESDQLALNGGAFLKNRKIKKVHALILLPAEKFEKIPKEMRARMIRRNSGWRGVRLVYCEGLFTAYGESGPFFQAQWNRGQL